jgi:hypothetical protein
MNVGAGEQRNQHNIADTQESVLHQNAPSANHFR